MLPVHFSSAESLKMFPFFTRVCGVSLCILIERSFGFLTPESYLFGASFGGRFNLKSKFCRWNTSGGLFSLVSCCWPLFIPFLHTQCCPKLRGCTKKLLLYRVFNEYLQLHFIVLCFVLVVLCFCGRLLLYCCFPLYIALFCLHFGWYEKQFRSPVGSVYGRLTNKVELSWVKLSSNHFFKKTKKQKNNAMHPKLLFKDIMVNNPDKDKRSKTFRKQEM